MSDLQLGEKIGGGVGEMKQPQPEGGREESGQWNKVVSSMKQMLQELDELVPGTTTAAAAGEQNFSPSIIHEEEADLHHSKGQLLEDNTTTPPSGDASCTGSVDNDTPESVFMFKPCHNPDSEKPATKTPLESQPSPLAAHHHVHATKCKSQELLLTTGAAPTAVKTKKKRSSAFNKWQRLITISSFLATKNKNSKSRGGGGGGGHDNNGHHDNNAATNSSSTNHNCSKNQVPKHRRALTIQNSSGNKQEEAYEATDCCVASDDAAAAGAAGKNVDRFSFNNFFSRSYSVEETAVRTPPLSNPNHRILKSTAASAHKNNHAAAYRSSRGGELSCGHHHHTREQAEQAIAAGNIFNQPEFFRTCSCDDKECNSPDGNRQHLWQQRQSKLSSSSVVWTPNFSSKRMQLRRIVSSDKKMSEHNLFENRQLQSFRDASGATAAGNWMEDGDEMSKKNKKSRFKKSFKSVSKQMSAPIATTDHFLERKWDTYGECIWCNLSGQQVELESTELSKLSELECEALQKVAVENIIELELPGIPVVIPKDDYSSWKQKHKLKKKYLLLMAKEKQKDKEFDHVFGIPLVQVVENDQLLRLQKSESFAPTMQKLSGSGMDEHFGEFTEGGTSSLSESSTIYSGAENSNAASTTSFDKVEEIVGIPLECDDDTFPSRSSSVPHTPRVGRINHSEAFEKGGLEVKTPPPLSSAAAGSNKNPNPATPGRPLRRRGAIGADSFHAIDPHQSQLLQALSLSVSNTSESGRQEKKEKASVLPPTMTQVPYIVQKCCDYITKCGLDITGIFRIAGSKKRVKQLREEFDRGVDVTIEESYNPHDVAALLKEFFRDLPEALLTRELYPSFLQSTDLKPELRLAFVRYLLWLLPIPNRDSLRTLLRFLNTVAQHHEDSVDDKGQKVTGNLMTVHNLATIFGPNLLHRYKKSTGQSTEGLYQGVERMEDSGGVIKVVEHLINHHIGLFEVPKENHDQILRKLKETEPEAVDFILRRKAANYVRQKSVQSEQSTAQQDNCIGGGVARASFPDVFGTVDDEENLNSYAILRSNLPNSSSPVTRPRDGTNCKLDCHQDNYSEESSPPPITSEKEDNNDATAVELRKQRSVSPTIEPPENSDSSPTSNDLPASPRFIKSHNANNCNNIKMIRKLNRKMRCMGGSVGSNLGQNVWLHKPKTSSPQVTFKPTPPTSLPLESKLKMDRDLADYREKLQLSSQQQQKRFKKHSKSSKVKANSSLTLVGANTAPGGKKYSKSSKVFTSSPSSGRLTPAASSSSSSAGSSVSSSRLPETKV